MSRLELNVSNNSTSLQDEIVTTVINLRFEHLDADDTGEPKVTHYFTGKEVLD